jgi:hypothetical protein
MKSLKIGRKPKRKISEALRNRAAHGDLPEPVRKSGIFYDFPLLFLVLQRWQIYPNIAPLNLVGGS